MLDLEVLDPDWTLAEIHGMASKTGQNVYEADDAQSKIFCRCCLNIVHQKPLPMCSHIKQLQYLGFGFPLFYFFLKNCILLLIISLASYCAMSLFLAIEHNNELCIPGTMNQLNCSTFMVKLSRNEPVVSQDQVILRIIGFTTYLIFLIYVRNYMIKKDSYYKERNTNISDYSIIMKNLPRIKGITSRLQKFFDRSFSRPHQIKEITLLSINEEIQNLRKEKKEIIKKLKKQYKILRKDPSYEIQGGEELEDVNKRLEKEYLNEKHKAERDEVETTRAILIFQSEQEKAQILNEFTTMENLHKIQYFGIWGKKITMKTAPQPKEIIWENMGKSNPKLHFLRLLFGWFWTIIILGIVTVIFFFVLREKGRNMKSANKYFNTDQAKYSEELGGAIAIVYVMLFLVIIFNKLILVEIIHKFVHMEKHTTTAGYQFSFATKYCIALFFTTALMTLAVEAIALQNYNSYLYGVVDEQTVMFFLNSAFVPLFWLINPKHLFKKLKRKRQYGRRDLTQSQANTLMEETSYDIGKRYAEIIEIMWFTSLYSSLIPIGAFVSLFGVAAYYWVDRYNLQRRSTLKYQVSGQMLNFALKLLDISLLLRPAGQILFDEQLRDGYQISSVVMLIVAAIYQILPMNRIIDFAEKEIFRMEQKKFKEVSFKNTYHNLHPLAKRVHFKQGEVKVENMNYFHPSMSIYGGTNRPLQTEPDHEIQQPSYLRPEIKPANQLEIQSA